MKLNIYLFIEQNYQIKSLQKARQEKRGFIGVRQGQGWRRTLGLDTINVWRIKSRYYRIRCYSWWRHQYFLSRFRTLVREASQDHDVECKTNHKISGQILDPEKLSLAVTEGVSAWIFSALRVWLRVCTVQVAKVAESAERKAENHLGLQNPLPWCHVPARC